MIAPWDEEYEPVQAAQPPGREPWFGLSQSTAFRSAQENVIGSELRLFLFAVARADRFGHAEFRQGELEQRLGIQASGVRKQIVKLKAAGLAAPEANARCVLLAYEVRGGGHRPDDPRRCGEHGAMGAATALPRESEQVPESRGAAFWLDLYQSETEAVLTGSAPTL